MPMTTLRPHDGHPGPSSFWCDGCKDRGYQFYIDLAGDLFSCLAEAHRDFPMDGVGMTWDEYYPEWESDYMRLEALQALGF